jgi:predicted glycoside hydrolase/deacetylase ChbG (UPF0249 family)
VGRLILNADDFGLTAGVNRAIMELHRAGTLTSTTLMARAAATAEAVRSARATPTLGVGCHVVLVDGDPMLPARKIPTLVDERTGRFQPTLGLFLKRLLAGRIRPSEIEAEACAQIAFLQGEGITLTHIDTHKHTHMFPAVLKPVLRAAGSLGIRAIRNPFEPAWSVRGTPGTPWIRRSQVILLRQLLPAFLRHVGAAGLLTTDGSIGVLATGTLDSTAISSLLGSIPPGTWEMVTHPGYNDAALAQARTRLLASRNVEREALLALRLWDELELISFIELAAG